MSLFTKPEVIILKESCGAKQYLEKLEALLPKTSGVLQKKIQKEITITKAGILGEENILFELKNSNMNLVVLHDIYIETKDGLGAQIDFVVVTPKLIYLIECKNLFGNIEIDAKGNFIRTMEFGGRKTREGIYSPITQNERHLAILKECKIEDKNIIQGALIRGTFDRLYKSLIVLANPKTVINDRYAKKEVKDQVLRADQMINVIKKMNSESKEVTSSKKDILLFAQKILDKNIEERKDYFVKYQELVDQIEEKETELPENTAKDIPEKEQSSSVEETVRKEQDKEPDKERVKEVNVECGIQTEEALLCPRCGSQMVLRTAQKGAHVGERFYGCSRFPKCRYVQKLDE